jgi:hypothetical protein
VIDVAALRLLLSNPRTKPWVAVAAVLSVQYDELAAWAQVKMVGTGMTARCRMTTSYLFAGGGLWIEPKVGAEAVVLFPSSGYPEQDGNVHPDLYSGIIVGLLSNNEDPPPAAGDDRPTQEKIVLSLDTGHELVVRRKGTQQEGGGSLLEVDGAGNITITSPGTVTVKAQFVVLPDDGSGLPKPMARVQDAVQAGPFAGVIVGPGNLKVVG